MAKSLEEITRKLVGDLTDDLKGAFDEVAALGPDREAGGPGRPTGPEADRGPAKGDDPADRVAALLGALRSVADGVTADIRRRSRG
ncbi:hypothetical protein [Streptomyces johnsoniae]|uniref:Uncharacterized protein n=1 Tax=Streptomyces johnsoniae TaxID=3075532 RepID=A0ABU2S5K9_9ACTN|nr:hypothetical protein [Streptomyces sp. DSM 41886]MDT0444253.1 hypothetical protein [Streptomyces sp. DSM 41886]